MISNSNVTLRSRRRCDVSKSSKSGSKERRSVSSSSHHLEDHQSALVERVSPKGWILWECSTSWGSRFPSIPPSSRPLYQPFSQRPSCSASSARSLRPSFTFESPTPRRKGKLRKFCSLQVLSHTSPHKKRWTLER